MSLRVNGPQLAAMPNAPNPPSAPMPKASRPSRGAGPGRANLGDLYTKSLGSQTSAETGSVHDLVARLRSQTAMPAPAPSINSPVQRQRTFEEALAAAAEEKDDCAEEEVTAPINSLQEKLEELDEPMADAAAPEEEVQEERADGRQEEQAEDVPADIAYPEDETDMQREETAACEASEVPQQAISSHSTPAASMPGSPRMGSPGPSPVSAPVSYGPGSATVLGATPAPAHAPVQKAESAPDLKAVAFAAPSPEVAEVPKQNTMPAPASVPEEERAVPSPAATGLPPAPTEAQKAETTPAPPTASPVAAAPMEPAPASAKEEHLEAPSSISRKRSNARVQALMQACGTEDRPTVARMLLDERPMEELQLVCKLDELPEEGEKRELIERIVVFYVVRAAGTATAKKDTSTKGPPAVAKASLAKASKRVASPQNMRYRASQQSGEVAKRPRTELAQATSEKEPAQAAPANVRANVPEPVLPPKVETRGKKRKSEAVAQEVAAPELDMPSASDDIAEETVEEETPAKEERQGEKKEETEEKEEEDEEEEEEELLGPESSGAELKEKLTELGLPSTGKKEVMWERIAASKVFGDLGPDSSSQDLKLKLLEIGLPQYGSKEQMWQRLCDAKADIRLVNELLKAEEAIKASIKEAKKAARKAAKDAASASLANKKNIKEMRSKQEEPVSASPAGKKMVKEMQDEYCVPGLTAAQQLKLALQQSMK